MANVARGPVENLAKAPHSVVPRIIFVNRYFFPDHSATSQMLTDLAFALAASGEFEIHVLTSRQRYDDATAGLAALAVERKVVIHRVWTSTFGRRNLVGRAFDYFTFYASAAIQLLILANPGAVVVAKTDPPLISVVVALAAKLKSAVLVNWIQDLFPEVAAALGIRLAKGRIYTVLQRLRNYSLKAADTNVVIGELMKQRLEKEGIAPARIRIIHNWADGEQIKPIAPALNALRKEWGLEGKFVVGYSGNFGRGHDFTTILDVAASLKDREDIRFLLIGGGAHRDWVEGETASRGLQNILFKPYQPRERLAESLSAADVHLVSLKPELEGLIVPSKFYGIAAAGRPVLFIGAPDGELARLVNVTKCGMQIDQGDAKSLRTAILRLSVDREMLTAIGDAGRKGFDESFSLENAVAAWRGILAACRPARVSVCQRGATE